MLELSPYHFSDRLMILVFALTAHLALLGLPIVQKALRLASFGQWFSRVLQRIEHKLNRETRSQRTRFWRGIVAFLLGIILLGNVSANLSALSAVHPLGWLMEVMLLGLFLPLWPLYHHGKNVAQAGDLSLEAGREALRQMCDWRVDLLDAYGVRRGATEILTSQFTTRIIAPGMWYLLLGLPGFVVHRLMTQSAQIMGQKPEKKAAFAQLALRMEQVLNHIPEYVAALCFLLAGLLSPRLQMRAGFKALFNRPAIAAPLKAAPIAVVAALLNTSLGGHYTIQNHTIKNAWTGAGSAKLAQSAYRRFIRLYLFACLIWLSALFCALQGLI